MRQRKHTHTHIHTHRQTAESITVECLDHCPPHQKLISVPFYSKCRHTLLYSFCFLVNGCKQFSMQPNHDHSSLYLKKQTNAHINVMNVGRHTLACECVKRPLLFCWIQSSDNGADVRWSWYRGHSPSARRSRSSPTKNKKTIHGGGELQGGEVRFHIPDWEGLWLPCWMQAPAVMWISHLAVAVYRKLETQEQRLCINPCF